MIAIFLLFIFVIMLCFPKIVFEGAKSGLLLWFHTVLPTLFPFFIVNTLLLQSGAISYISRILAPIFTPVFHTSECSSYAILAGFFCGTPVGSKIIVDLVLDQKISPEEGEYLLSFCNLTSPGFVIGFLFEQCLQAPELAYFSFLILIISSVFSSFLFRNWYCVSPVSNSLPQNTTNYQLDETIQETNEALLKIGGYIMLFCSLLFVLKSIPFYHFIWNCILLPSLELTNGVKLISAMHLPFKLKYVLLMTLTSFGGLCAAFQTKCIIQKVHFSFLRYIKEKLVTAMVTSLLSFLFIQLST